MLLKNKYAVISGAASENGIGYATARLFAEHGATVALLDLEQNSPQKKAAILGENHRGYVCNVTKKDACETAARQIIEDFGGVDILINNAGITQPIRIMDVKPENYDAVIDVNGGMYIRA
jgi:NAD(P)-dependent dehydrogenase (short-subunit alcohol dehydrogenase family)